MAASPIVVPSNSKFIGIGLNFSDHAAETGAKPPTEPIVFMKATSCINGPNDDIEITKDSKKLHSEDEIVNEILKHTKHISENHTQDQIIAYLDDTVVTVNLKKNEEKIDNIYQSLIRFNMEQALVDDIRKFKLNVQLDNLYQKTVEKLGLKNTPPKLSDLYKTTLIKKVLEYSEKIKSFDAKLNTAQNEYESSKELLEISKKQTEINEKYYDLFLKVAENSAAVSYKWASDTITKMQEAPKYDGDPSGYTKSLGDFVSAQADVTTENLAAYAEIAKKAQMDSVSLFLSSAKTISSRKVLLPQASQYR